jgi:H+/Cl- antiporter ClcA
MKKTVFKNYAVSAGHFIFSFLKWLICAVFMGIICGAIGTAFHFAIHDGAALFTAHPKLIFALPVFGLIIVYCYRECHMEHNADTNAVLRSVHSPESVPLKLAPLTFLGTVLTHLGGGSAGREGAALQIGGSIGAWMSKLLKFDQKDRTLMTLCGMSALFSALFATPITAAVFCMEVVTVGIFHYSAFVPCLTSAVIANYLASFLGVAPSNLATPLPADFSLPLAGKIVILAAIVASASIIFCIVVHGTGNLYKKLFKNPYLRITIGGILMILLTYAVGTLDYNNSGMELIQKALLGQTGWEAPFLKLLFTAVTLGAGFKGGEIVPAFCVGATLGCSLSGLLGIDPSLAAAIGLISLFCGVVNCPLASILLSIELFGSNDLLLFCIAVSVSYMLSGYYGLYSSQKIMYSKTEPNFIDKELN